MTSATYFLDGLMEATLSPVRLPKQLKIATLIVGLTIPVLVSAGTIIQFVGTITGTLVRFDRYRFILLIMSSASVISVLLISGMAD